MRGTTNRNVRGNSRDRAARRRWLLKTFRSDVDHRDTCRCWRCGVELGLTRDSGCAALLTVDRIIPGCRGGTYRRNNIRPACSDCNSETGGATRRRAA